MVAIKVLFVTCLLAVSVVAQKKDEKAEKPKAGAGTNTQTRGHFGGGSFGARPHNQGFGGRPHNQGFGSRPVHGGNVGGFNGYRPGGNLGTVGVVGTHGVHGAHQVGGFPGSHGVGGLHNVGGFPGAGVGVGGVFPGAGVGVGGFPGAGIGVGGAYPGGGVGVGVGGGLHGGGGLGLATQAPPASCRYWCRTPEGQAYCCENVNEATSLVVGTKPGRCPPVRPTCNTRYGPPVTCSNDAKCSGIDKCCFDRCLQEHVCKPPLGVGK